MCRYGYRYACIGVGVLVWAYVCRYGYRCVGMYVLVCICGYFNVGMCKGV